MSKDGQSQKSTYFEVFLVFDPIKYSSDLVISGKVKQLQNVPVPQADLREPTISVRPAIIANFQLLKSDFLE